MNKSRAEALSDGVFGFAITLLVLGIAVPTLSSPSDEELRRALLHAGAALLPYVTSFATIGVIWLNHHRMFTCVQRVDHATLTLNLLVLFVVAFLPYPTAVLGRFGAMPSSAFLYGSTMSLLGISYSLLARHIQRKGLTVSEEHIALQHMSWKNVVGTVAYPSATVLSLWLPRASILVFFGLAMFYFLPARSPSQTDSTSSSN